MIFPKSIMEMKAEQPEWDVKAENRERYLQIKKIG